MTTGATGQLGLALPVQGELSGTWGDTVNNGITQYTNIAIAATLTLTNDGAVTLANTTGDASASNIVSSLTGAGTVTAQFAIVKVTGTLTTPKIITAPSYSKTYIVVNAATGSTVSFIRSGQTPAVSIAVGESAWVYYNGTDYVKIAGTTSGSAGGSNTQVQYNSSGALAGSANLTFSGTTLTLQNGYYEAYDPADTTSAGYGMRFYTNGGGTKTENGRLVVAQSGTGSALSSMIFQTNNGTSLAEQMRLTSTGLGIGTTSPAARIGIAIPNFTASSTSGMIRFQNPDVAADSCIQSYYVSSDGSDINIGANSFVNTAGSTARFSNSYASSAINIRRDGVLVFRTNTSAGDASERMRIDSSGNVGIGTTTATAKLTVINTADANKQIVFGDSAIYYGSVGHNSGTGLNEYRTEPSGGHGFFIGTSGTANMTLNSSGNLGIGTTSPSYKLHVRGADATATLVVGNTSEGTQLEVLTYQDDRAVLRANDTSNVARAIAFETGTTERARISAAGGFSVGTTADPGAGAIYATGNITAYYSSDIKFKENVRDIPDALATVNAIGGKLFDWKDDYIESKGGADGYFVQKADFGVVAQDVQKVFPIAVRTREDGSLAVDYEKLGALAFAALVELTKRVEALEAK